MAASQPENTDTPKRQFLKRGIHKLTSEIKIKNKELKVLKQTIRRQNKKIVSLKSIISKLQKENLINEEASNVLLDSFGKHTHLISNWAKKNLGHKVPKKYSPEIRQFALSLHFFSCKAYNYVRKQFNTVLPHPRTLSKWYSSVNANPGFTEESLKMLSLKAQNSNNPIICALMLDEMAIRQHIDYDGTNYYGHIDIGNGINNDSLAAAKECLVIMIVSVNENWKLPIGYFLVNSLNSSQKAELVKHALNLLSNITNLNVVSLTFDGCSTNVTMSQLLGCNFNADCLNTSFLFNSTNSTDHEIVVLLDPAHMIKLVRNALGEKKKFLDYKNNIIDFDFIQKLFILQENEGCHLGNKLRKQHIFYNNQKMKVKLATQMLSQSVADALKFCKNNLNLKEFSDCDGTINFIEMFNKAFDILNSRSINSIGSKKALCKENFVNISNFVDEFTIYIKGLKVQDNINDVNYVPILNSKRKTGFIGFIICLNSMLKLYYTLIDSSKIDYLKMHKLSQ